MHAFPPIFPHLIHTFCLGVSNVMCVYSCVIADLVPSLYTILAVLADLKEAGIFTSEESEKLRHLKDVIRIQSGKSLQVMVETAKVLRRRGLEEEYQHLTGRLLFILYIAPSQFHGMFMLMCRKPFWLRC